MRLLLDEHISPIVAEQLRRRGHDVVAAGEVGLLQRPDPEIFTWAAAAGRGIVTQNVKDFHLIHALHLSRGESHRGLVLLSRRHPLSQAAFGSLVVALDGMLQSHPADDALESAEYWL